MKVNVTEVINHPDFVENIRGQLIGIHIQNVMLGESRFKMSPIETLSEKGISTENIPNAYLEVLSGKSTLSSRERNFVKSIGYKALIETYNKYFTKK